MNSSAEYKSHVSLAFYSWENVFLWHTVWCISFGCCTPHNLWHKYVSASPSSFPTCYKSHQWKNEQTINTLKPKLASWEKSRLQTHFTETIWSEMSAILLLICFLFSGPLNLSGNRPTSQTQWNNTVIKYVNRCFFLYSLMLKPP